MKSFWANTWWTALGRAPHRYREVRYPDSIGVMPLPRRLLFAANEGAYRLAVNDGQTVTVGEVLALPVAAHHAPIVAPMAAVVQVLPVQEDVIPIQLLPTRAATVAAVGGGGGEAPGVVPLRTLVRLVWQAGVAGMGGAGFATHRKLELAAKAQVHTLIVNAVECEPGLVSDAYLLRYEGDRVARGVQVLRQALALERVVLAVKNIGDEGAHCHLSDAMAGGEFFETGSTYPAGDERVLVRQITGSPLVAATRPIEQGVLVFNAATVAAIADAAVNQPLAHRLLSVRGPSVPRPRVLRVYMGTPFQDVLAACGISLDGLRIVAGGPIMGREVAATDGVGPWTTGVWLEPPRERPTPYPCIRCGLCVDACPMGLHPQALWAAITDDPPSLQAVDGCTGCRACDLVCPSHLPLAERFLAAQASKRQQVLMEQQAAAALVRFKAREARVLSRQARSRRSGVGAKTDVNALLVAAKQHRGRS